LRDIQYHRQRIDHLAKQMPRLRAITIHLHIGRHEDVAACKQTLSTQHASFTTLDLLTKFHVFYNDFVDLDAHDWAYGKGQGPVMVWKAETGVLVDTGARWQMKTAVRSYEKTRVWKVSRGQSESEFRWQGAWRLPKTHCEMHPLLFASSEGSRAIINSLHLATDQ